MPEITVIIPARDAAAWLPRAILSVGPSEAVEILVVDDGSTDGTPALLAGMAAHDPRLRVLPGPGRGPAAARNLGLAAARGPWVAFLDADDRWRLDKLAAQLAFHRAHPEMGFSFTDYRHRLATGEDRGACFAFWPRFAALVAGRTQPFLLPEAADALLAENVVGTSTVMARADLLRELGGFDEALRQAEDWDLWLRLAARAPVGCLPREWMDYTLHRPGNLSGARRARLAALRDVARRHSAGAARGAVRACAARLLVAGAEAAAAEGARGRAALLRLAAALRQPTRRLWREAAAAMLARG
jgi:glycosyltransferase involved in cell wall biosynthesis